MLRSRFGMIALDEGHKARIQRSMGKEKSGKLYTAIKKLGARIRHLVIATATPIQTDNKEIWDLMKLLARSYDHVLGREGPSRWWDPVESLALITARQFCPVLNPLALVTYTVAIWKRRSCFCTDLQ